ncbi:Nramp family divalent metal transporter [Brachybacterium avium]|uniref:Nramp family divalent metal transporter n=1 Tax=Brachybacterium avium TaxID=2017485 RepID=UPI0012FDD1A8|nr:Nramp family divalent metal transporter [Brachybacterium avium]
MSTTAPPPRTAETVSSPRTTTLGADIDPYLIDGSQITEPPRRLGGKLRFLGPGMITSAAVVGSGELLTATTLGAQVGFMLLWLVLVSTFLKVWVQIELARWSISTGRVALDGYQDVPRRSPVAAGSPGWCCSCSCSSSSVRRG